MLNREIVKGFQSIFKDDIDKRIKDQDVFKFKSPKKTIVIHKKDGTLSKRSSDLNEKYLEDIEDITFEFKYTVRIENYEEIYNIDFDHTDYFQYRYNSICLEKISYENFIILRRNLSKYFMRDAHYDNPATFKFSIVIKYSDYKKELNRMFLNLNTSP